MIEVVAHTYSFTRHEDGYDHLHIFGAHKKLMDALDKRFGNRIQSVVLSTDNAYYVTIFVPDGTEDDSDVNLIAMCIEEAR